MSARLTALALTLFAFASSALAGVPDWVRAAIPAQLPPADDARSIVLLDDTALTVANEGTITSRHRRVVKILTPAGREDAYVAVWFDGDTKLRAMRGWSIDRAGQEYTVKEKDAVEANAGDYELFTDARMKVLRIPAEVGSVVAFEYERNERPYLLQSAWHFQEDIPVMVARFQVTLPTAWTYEARWLNHAPVSPMGANTFEVRSVPAIKDEPRRPTVASIAARAGFDFVPPGAKALDWAGLARWYASLAAQRTASTPALQAKVRELTSGASDPIKPLARFAQRDVRYVAVEVGIGGYQPHAAGDIFSKRFGDCKDKVTLLRTMLKEAGIEAMYVLVHTDRGTTDPQLPSMSAFNHVIAAIPVSAATSKGMPAVIDHPRLGKLLLFDPTSTLTPYGELPEYLQASRGLIVTKDGGELIELPAHAPDASQLRRVAKLQLDEHGTLSGTIEETRTGSMAASMRGALQALTFAERVRRIETNLSAHLTNYTTADVTIEHLDEPEQDLVIRYSINAPQYAKRVADMLLVRPRIVGEKSEGIVKADRAYAYVTDGPSLQLDEVDIRMPANAKLDELPEKVEAKTPHVEYSSVSTFADGVLHYRRRYSQKAYVIATDAVKELNRAWSAILADERANAVFR
ncbi:MAG: DUF3857 and transglutaminase domain-containing protein [Acidobacteriota bacterium]|nr:DUF3857 and transglutaminase domain-containing protein [Acidobacteriota bacterium]